MNAINSKNKGFITGLLIVLVSSVAYYFKRSFDNSIIIIAYLLYATGIIWTLVAFHREGGNDKRFKDYFQQGFRCYIIVTLIMVCATWIFLKLNVSMRNEMIEFQREQLKLHSNYSDPDIEQKLINYRKFLLPGYTIGAILSYLGSGTLITVLISTFLSKFKTAQ